jgi:hypothetical protein
MAILKLAKHFPGKLRGMSTRSAAESHQQQKMRTLGRRKDHYQPIAIRDTAVIQAWNTRRSPSLCQNSTSMPPDPRRRSTRTGGQPHSGEQVPRGFILGLCS